MSNIGWHFYKNYFKDIDYANLENEQNTTKIKQKINSILHQHPKIEQDEALGNAHFKATTTYPGLLLGSGYLHEIPDVKEQLIIGFDFDYTTGLPIIRGSSIKGVLRSAFKHIEYIKELLGNENIDIQMLESEIFDNGDIFFDAVIEKYGTTLLSDDYLAPHKEAIKNPIPLRFLKVSPNVTFRFDFILSDGIISKQDKLELFKKILADLGIGAKTNVGYGKFSDFSNYQTKEEREKSKEEEIANKFNKAINSNSLEILEKFKIDYPNYQYIDKINQKIKELVEEEERKDIKQAYENLDKSNQKHINSFINKYKDNPLAKEFIENLQNLLNNQSNKNTQASIKDLENAKNAKAIKNILEKVDVSQDDYSYIEEIVTKLYQSLKGKQKKNFFKEAQIGRFINKDYETQIKSKLGAK